MLREHGLGLSVFDFAFSFPLPEASFMLLLHLTQSTLFLRVSFSMTPNSTALKCVHWSGSYGACLGQGQSLASLPGSLRVIDVEKEV